MVKKLDIFMLEDIKLYNPNATKNTIEGVEVEVDI